MVGVDNVNKVVHITRNRAAKELCIIKIDWYSMQ